MASFRKALQCGATGLEFDVRRCGDGRLVVIHDDTIDRTTNGSGRVADLSYEQLRQFDAGDGEPIPLLADVLDCHPGFSYAFFCRRLARFDGQCKRSLSPDKRIAANVNATDRLERLTENLRCARQIYGQRVTLEGPAAASVLDEVIERVVEAKAETSFGRELADVATDVAKSV